MIVYNSRDINFKKPYGAVKTGVSVNFNITVSANGDTGGPVETNLIICKENCTPETIKGREKGDNYSFNWRGGTPGLYFYYFSAAFSGGAQERTGSFQLTVFEHDGLKQPDWLSSGLMYQVFPDRFARCGAYTIPDLNKSHTIHERWGELPVCAPDENGVTWNNDFFGGNLRGVIEKLDYLEGIGVTVIYLNPIFEAFSNHRYDTGDYHKIDPILGSEEDFSLLCEMALQKGIRIVLDGVFNHTGSDSLYFNKYGHYKSIGACQSKDSPYYKWYSFTDYPDEYESWWGIKTLPQVNEKEKSYIDFIIRDENSVARHWLRAGASGLRLDVVDELPDEFLDELRVVVKEEKQDALLIGEVWEDASNKIAYDERRRYFQGKQLDSVMNYPLKDAIIRYIGYDHIAKEFSETVESLRENYPSHVFNSLMNILGTHDTKRILTVFRESSGDYWEARQKLFSALLIWALMPGIPCVYYGDELGMEGGKDPLNRQCFNPETKNEEIALYYKRLLNFRKKIKDIDQKEFVPLSAHGGYYSFERRGDTESVVVAVNDQNLSEKLTFGGEAVDFIISGAADYLGDNTFEIHERSGIAVLIRCVDSHA